MNDRGRPLPVRQGRAQRHTRRREHEAPRVVEPGGVPYTFLVEGSFPEGLLGGVVYQPEWSLRPIGTTNYAKIGGEGGTSVIPTASGLWLITAQIGMSGAWEFDT